MDVSKQDLGDPAEITRLTGSDMEHNSGAQELVRDMPQPANDSPVQGPISDKRRRYVIVFSVTLLTSLLGLSLVIYWIYFIRKKTGISLSDPDQLTNLHPILMYTFMSSLNIYSVLIYRTHVGHPKGVIKLLHAFIMGSCLVAGTLGVVAIFWAHHMKNGSDWYSLHSWIGTLTLSLFTIQFIAGFVAFLKPGLTAQTRADLMPWHRFGGVLLLILSSGAVVTGIAEFALFSLSDYTQFKELTFVANSAGMCVVFSAIGTGYLLTEATYRRPNQVQGLLKN